MDVFWVEAANLEAISSLCLVVKPLIALSKDWIWLSAALFSLAACANLVLVVPSCLTRSFFILAIWARFDSNFFLLSSIVFLSSLNWVISRLRSEITFLASLILEE